MKKHFSLFAIAAIVLMPLAQVLAFDTGSLPACQFTGAPTPEQIQACQQAAQNAAQGSGQSGAPSGMPGSGSIPGMPPTGSIPQMPSGIPTNIPTGMTPPTGMMPQSGNFDFSQFGAPPTMEAGGMMPTFMGKPLAGGDNPAAGQIGNALDMIQGKLLDSDSGITEMKNGGIDTKDIEATVNKSKDLINKAKEAFQSGDYQTAGTYLQQMQSLNLQQKFSTLEDKAVSKDLISDVKAKMQNALKQMNQSGEDDEEILAAKAKVNAGLDQVTQAESLLNKGDKKGAAQIMKSLRDMSPDGEAAAAGGNFKGMGGKMMDKALTKISDGLERASKGLAKAKENGVDVPTDAQTLLEKAKTVYNDAKAAFDKGDYTTTAAKLTELKDLNLQETFTAYREQMLPVSRLQSFYAQSLNAEKGLEMTILHAKEYGMDTSEIEKILDQVRAINAKAKGALDSKDTETFLMYMDSIAELNIKEKVNTIIQKVAQERAAPMVKEGLDRLNAAADDLEKIAAKVKNDTATGLLKDFRASITKAQTFYDSADYKSSGRQIDASIGDMLKITNILKDSGAKLSAAETADINSVVTDSKSTSDFANLSSDNSSKMASMMNNINPSDINDMKNTLMRFNPELLDQVIASREKDKAFVDGVMKDVLPYVPEADRQDMLQGKINLLDESKAADTTIATVKKLKGISASAPKDLQSIMDQVKKYNFTGDVAENLTTKIADFNDKVQTGELKDTTEINGYIKALKDEVSTSMKKSSAEKYKDGILPAKNIDDNNPLFDEVKQLKDDGALKADKNGNIDLTQKVDKKKLAEIINNTVDKKAIAPTAGNANIGDVIKTSFTAYGIKPTFNVNDKTQMANFATKQLGTNIKPTDLSKPATLDIVTSIVANADERWGR